ncbi:unnamed protein product, partial [Effrenium voratum]
GDLSVPMKRFNWATEMECCFTPHNPKRAKTQAFKRYEQYKGATTVGMARAAGASYRDLDNDYQHEYMTKVQPAPAECPTAKNKAKEVLEQEPQELLPEPIAESVVTEPAAMVVH